MTTQAEALAAAQVVVAYLSSVPAPTPIPTPVPTPTPQPNGSMYDIGTFQPDGGRHFDIIVPYLPDGVTLPVGVAKIVAPDGSAGREIQFATYAGAGPAPWMELFVSKTRGECVGRPKQGTTVTARFTPAAVGEVWYVMVRFPSTKPPNVARFSATCYPPG